MSIESEVTGGRATWLEMLRYDPAAALVEIRTVVPDDPGAPTRRVTFTGVSEYIEEPFDPALPSEPDVLEHLVGIDVHAHGSATRYVIATDERHLTFCANAPRIEILGIASSSESDRPAA
jgi:hypothetical protein